VIDKKLRRSMKVGIEAGEKLKRHRERIYKQGKEAAKVINEFKKENKHE